MTAIIFGSVLLSCDQLALDLQNRVATCGQLTCRYESVNYDLTLGAVQVECLRDELLRDGFEALPAQT
ncbi:MAG: hypothetical protein AAGA23_02535 [Pseudomonadota bacterium]